VTENRPGAVSRTVHRWPGDQPDDDLIAVEEPLEIRVEGKPLAVTMRTPGDDLDLAAGFLYTEGVIDGADDLVALAHVDLPRDLGGNTIDCVLAGGVPSHRAAIERATRDLYATSSCGLCGKASIDRLLVGAPPLPQARAPDPDVLLGLPARLLEAQASFAQTGGLHAAGLFHFDGALEVLREDIGRHNAVDKVIGWRLRQDRVPVDDRILFVSGRAGFEIVQKALVARIPVLAAVGAASTLAIDLASRGRLVLVGFVRDGRYNRYA
jgi:FdhD protein